MAEKELKMWVYVTFSDVQLDVGEVHKAMQHMVTDRAPFVDGRLKAISGTSEFGNIVVTGLNQKQIKLALKEMGDRL